MTTKIQLRRAIDGGMEDVVPVTSEECVMLNDGRKLTDFVSSVENDEFSPTITQVESMAKVGVGTDVDVSANVQEGYVKSAILSGQTLVNLVSGMNTIETNAVFKDGYITLTQKTYDYLACYITFAYALAEGKKYLLVMDVKENTLGEILRTTTGSCIASGVTIVPNGSTGIIKYIMTISGGDSLDRIALRSNSGDFSGSITFKPMLIPYQEGMENWDIPYFEGMQSVKLPVLTTTGRIC